MLGRVMAVDFGFATMCEAFSAMAAGILQDEFGMTAWDVYYLIHITGIAITSFWIVYFYLRWGLLLELNGDTNLSHN